MKIKAIITWGEEELISPDLSIIYTADDWLDRSGFIKSMAITIVGYQFAYMQKRLNIGVRPQW